MDPNEALKDIRRLISEINSATDADEGADLGSQLAQAVAALDAWLVGGGFYPKAWEEGW